MSGLAFIPASAQTDGKSLTRAKPPCLEKTSACLETIARTYLDALISHDGSRIPLSPTVRRTESGLTNARGQYEVRESFVRTDMMERLREVRVYVDAPKGEVVAYFIADIDLKGKGR